MDFYIFDCGGSLLLCRLSLVAVSRCCSPSRCMGYSLWWLLLLCVAHGAWASVVAACGLGSCSSRTLEHGLTCLAACGIFLALGSNWCPLYCKAGS